jgi:serine/threonine protein kinase
MWRADRDIKPENFIVTDGFATTADGRRERKVIVKLSDFGLSTTDVDSSDMDCGSAPYMSFGMCLSAECERAFSG